MTNEIADVLERAADLIEPEGCWTQGAFARTAYGQTCLSGRDANAACWCIYGALDRAGFDLAATDEAHNNAEVLLRSLIRPNTPARWQDAPERTQAEVVAKLREAALASRLSDHAGGE